MEGGGGDISSQDSPNTSFQSGFISANTSISDYRAGDTSDTGQLELTGEISQVTITELIWKHIFRLRGFPIKMNILSTLDYESAAEATDNDASFEGENVLNVFIVSDNLRCREFCRGHSRSLWFIGFSGHQGQHGRYWDSSGESQVTG